MPPPAVVHKVSEFEFEFWRGDVPSRFQQQVERFTRVGVRGVSHRLIGRRGEPFSAELVSWHQTRDDARDALRDYEDLIGNDPVQVTKDGEDLEAKEGVLFVVEKIVEVSCQANILLHGRGKSYASGVELVTRWTMTPVEA